MFESATPLFRNKRFRCSTYRKGLERSTKGICGQPEIHELTLTSIILHDIEGNIWRNNTKKVHKLQQPSLKSLDTLTISLGKFVKSQALTMNTQTTPLRLPNSARFRQASHVFQRRISTYNSRKDFDWNKIVALIYSKKTIQLVEELLAQKRKEHSKHYSINLGWAVCFLIKKNSQFWISLPHSFKSLFYYGCFRNRVFLLFRERGITLTWKETVLLQWQML